MNAPNKSRVYICSIVKNAERGLLRNIPIINELRGRFAEAKVYVYENDSTDGTKNILKAWSDSDPNNITVSLNVSPPLPSVSPIPTGVIPFFSRARIEKMVFLRNKYLDYIRQSGWYGDYLMVVDLDVDAFDVKGIMTSFEAQGQWDAVTAYGYSLSPKLKLRYHDTYAFVSDKKGYADAQTSSDIYAGLTDFDKVVRSQKWLKVKSAFGGLAIYRWSALQGVNYQLEFNHDANVEVYCEHRSIYRQMYEKGYDNFFINPMMKVKYPFLNSNIFFGYIKRAFYRLFGK